MDNLKLLNKIKKIYSQNKNIIGYLKQLNHRNINTTEDILISYDFQAGTYIKAYKNNPALTNKKGEELAKLISTLGGALY